MRVIKIGLLALLLGSLVSCATVDLDCPSGGSVEVATIDSPNAVDLFLKILPALTVVGVLRKAPDGPSAAAPTVIGHVHLTTVPFFGPNSVSCGPAAPVTKP